MFYAAVVMTPAVVFHMIFRVLYIRITDHPQKRSCKHKQDFKLLENVLGNI